MARESRKENCSSDPGARTVKSYRPSLADKAWEIERACFPDPWERKAFDEIGKAASLYQGIVCLGEKGELQGYLIYYEVLDEAHILNLAVSPEWRRDGIGSELLRHFERKVAQEKEARLLLLEVRSRNIAARSLYEKLGYEQFSVRKYYYPNDKDDALVLCKYVCASSELNNQERHN